MTMGVNIGSDAASDIVGFAFRKAAGGAGLKTIAEAWIRQSKTLIQQFYATIQIALSAYTAIGRGNSAGTVSVTSGPITATVTGGIGVLSHAWTRTDGGAHAWTIDNPTGETTTFTTIADQDEDWEATFIDTVTDQAGQVIASAAVDVTCANIYYGGGYGGLGGSGHAYP